MKKIILLITFVILISLCIQKPNQKKFAGQTLNFRSDLIQAQKTEVYPSETALKDVLLSPEVAKIWIAYFPNDQENAYYLVAAYEFSYKMTIVNKYYFQLVKRIEVLALNSTEELLPTKEEPVVLLLGPSKTNETSVRVDDYLITASGKDFSEINRQYTDLDLAVDKLLLVLMEV